MRVLHVFGSLNCGGAETVIMNLYRELDRSKIQFDFVTHSNIEGYYEREIIENGGKIFRLQSYRVYNHFRYERDWSRTLPDLSMYSAIHVHVSNFAFGILPVLKKKRVQRIIVHAHSASDKNIVKRIFVLIFRRYIRKNSHYRLAVSTSAAEFAFGRKHGALIVPNGINLSRFHYSVSDRKFMRDALGLSGKLVIGHVGRFADVKNHRFLLEVFSELRNSHPESVMLLVGDGPLRKEIESYSLNARLDVRFLGLRDDVHMLMQAMDVFCLPSLYEGMPVVSVEAQATGLPCVMSDSISDVTALIPDIVRFLPINAGAKIWVKNIVELFQVNRINRAGDIKEAGFDVADLPDKYQSIYSGAISETEYHLY